MNRIKLLALGIAAAAATLAFAQTIDPDAALKQIQALVQQRLQDAQTNHKQVDFDALEKETIAKARECAKGLDIKKMDPKQGLAWARLLAEAKMLPEVCEAAAKFLHEASPNPTDKFDAQMLMLQACSERGEGRRVNDELAMVKAPDAQKGQQLAAMTLYVYVDAIKKDLGASAALQALDNVEKSLPAVPATDARSKAQALSQKFDFVSQRASLLQELNRKDEAVKLVQDFKGGLEANSPLVRQVNGQLTRMTMVGAPAPGLATERGYGGFKSLADLKGKVVLVDFFAHWCGPCIASFPEMIGLYNEFHAKGLEVVGFTTYYGYYATENREKRDMPKDVEFAKMREFLDKYKLPWPVVYGERTNFDAYGVTGIPHVAVIDRNGVVRKIKIGYSPESFKSFKDEVAKLLNEKS